MVKCNPFTPAPPASHWPTPTPRFDPPDAPFPFLSLPLELRQQIYDLLVPRVICYRQRDTYEPPWTRAGRPHRPASHVAILVTSRQLHDECREVIFRQCSILLETRWPRRPTHEREQRVLKDALSAMPESARMEVRRIGKDLAHAPYFRPSDPDPDSGLAGPKIDELFVMYTHLVDVARVFAGYFPALRDLSVTWSSFELELMERFGPVLAGIHDEGEASREKSVEELADVVAAWLVCCVGDGIFQPPVWLRLQFDASNNAVALDRWRRGVMQDALMLAQSKLATRVLAGDELEASGQMWLQRLSGKRKRGRKGWIEEE